jgi:hypothetical protein
VPFLESMQCTNLKSLEFFGNPSCDTTPWLEWCLQICPSVTNVYIIDMQNLTTESFELPAFTCGTLTTLHLQRCSITNAMAPHAFHTVLHYAEPRDCVPASRRCVCGPRPEQPFRNSS